MIQMYSNSHNNKLNEFCLYVTKIHGTWIPLSILCFMHRKKNLNTTRVVKLLELKLHIQILLLRDLMVISMLHVIFSSHEFIKLIKHLVFKQLYYAK